MDKHHKSDGSMFQSERCQGVLEKARNRLGVEEGRPVKRRIEYSVPEATYKRIVTCSNCGLTSTGHYRAYKVRIETGTPIEEWPCPKCGCLTLADYYRR